jgi:hypothetical protein
MQSEQATPAWSEENSASFIAYGRFFNPERERQFEVIGDLVAAAARAISRPSCSVDSRRCAIWRWTDRPPCWRKRRSSARHSESG